MTPPHVLIVVVLYKQKAAESEAVQTILEGLHQQAAFVSRFSLLLYDNSPEAQQIPSFAVPAHYVHDSTNGGLAAAYNHALAAAQQTSSGWLMLFDQDTRLTPEYLEEAAQLVSEHAHNLRVGAFAPHLVAARGLQSPHLVFQDMVRRQVTFIGRRPLVAPKTCYGLQEERWSAFNSGVVLRVSAVESIGGFPSQFWLDFLDIAVFHALYARGYRLFFMHSTLEHSLSVSNEGFYQGEGAFARHRNILRAMCLYICRYGDAFDRFLNRCWLVRTGLSQFWNLTDKRFARESFRRAIFLRERR